MALLDVAVVADAVFAAVALTVSLVLADAVAVVAAAVIRRPPERQMARWCAEREVPDESTRRERGPKLGEGERRTERCTQPRHIPPDGCMPPNRIIETYVICVSRQANERHDASLRHTSVIIRRPQVGRKQHALC